MTTASTRVHTAIAELETALGAYLREEARPPISEAAEAILKSCSPWLIQTLLDSLPTLAHPWRVTDMRGGEPIRLVRDGYHGEIASVKRNGSGRRDRPRWMAFVGGNMVSPEDLLAHGDAMPIDWSTLEAAKDACDAQLRAEGVTIVEESK